jgi:signal transduction histidine kinase
MEQSKLASMGEMIGNIAHQWRQPLSIIGTASSSMELQKKLNILEDDTFYKSCNTINKNLKYLSQTIDDFRDFIKDDRIKQEFQIQDMIDSFLILNDSIITNHNINIILDIENNLTINSYKNELIQCLLNIFNNSVYAFSKKHIKEKYIFINIKQYSNYIIITIKDNAMGIDNTIINKIFEPYFTTKHKSKGTGLGLHMTYKLITEGMNGNIEVKNDNYIYNNLSYKGSLFTIKIPFQ